jgi:hypothetical protein
MEYQQAILQRSKFSHAPHERLVLEFLPQSDEGFLGLNGYDDTPVVHC